MRRHPHPLVTIVAQPRSDNRANRTLPRTNAGEWDAEKNAGEGDAELRRKLGGYPLQHSLDVPEYILIPKSHHAIPSFLEYSSTPRIVLLVHLMLRTVQLDHEFHLHTTKIHDERPDRMLPAKLEILQLASAQIRPQPPLGIGGIPPHLSGISDRPFRGGMNSQRYFHDRSLS